MGKSKTITFYIFLLTSNCIFSQGIFIKKDLVFINEKTSVTANNSAGIHGFYKKYISSQDGSNCQFSPSCSHYAKLSFKKYGYLKGIILISDRLIRCNGIFENYFLSETGKVLDLP